MGLFTVYDLFLRQDHYQMINAKNVGKTNTPILSFRCRDAYLRLLDTHPML